MTERWAIALEGSPIDLKNASRFFGNTSSRSVRIGTIETSSGRTFPALFAASFETLSEHEDVQKEGHHLLDLINGVLFVGDRGREPLRISSVHPRTPEGWGPGYSFMSGQAKGRSSAFGDLTGGSPVEPSEVYWIELAQEVEEVRDVLLFMRTSEPDWFDLYKVSEMLSSAKKQGWFPADLLKAFKGSAQFERHAFGDHEAMDPKTRMDIDQARDFIRGTARQWLEWWSTNEVEARAASRTKKRKLDEPEKIKRR